MSASKRRWQCKTCLEDKPLAVDPREEGTNEIRTGCPHCDSITTHIAMSGPLWAVWLDAIRRGVIA